jgi:hypothetical protein
MIGMTVKLFNIAIGLLIASTFFCGWIPLMKQIWPAYLSLAVKYNMPTIAHSALYINT